MPKVYIVGGYVRDSIMNIKSKDIDYVFVDDISLDVDTAYNNMITYIQQQNYTIFLESKSCFTIRCKKDVVVDFVLARKETYRVNNRIPSCTPATLYEDLLRRDFTINAIAQDEDGVYYDYFEGMKDIKNKILRTPQDPYISFSDDPLRLLRAMRFKITKGFQFSKELQEAFNDDALWNKMRLSVSNERIREELYKCFDYNTLETLEFLKTLNSNKLSVLFQDKLWLKPSVR